MKKVSILIADDHQLFRSGVRHLLRTVDDLQVIGETRSGRETIAFCKDQQPDLVLMDIDFPDLGGVEITKIIKHANSNIKILALSMHDEDSYVVNMFRGGVSGYVVKDASFEELIRAIRAIRDGNSYFSKNISKSFFEQQNSRSKLLQKASKKVGVTDRELEILKYVTDEMTNKEIAERLFISPRTVETHKRNLMQKLQVKNTVGLVKYYLKLSQDTENKVII